MAFLWPRAKKPSKKKKYLIAGMGPGTSGVGRLMSHLVPVAENAGYKVIYLSYEHFLCQTDLAKHICHIWQLTIRRIIKCVFILRIFFIANADIIFIHPQSAGFGIFLRLCKKNKVSLYVVDNSFFCMKSYNYNSQNNIECLRCLGRPGNHDAECAPFPKRMSSKKYVTYLLRFKELSNQINFLVQNELQKSLLREHFGGDVSCKIVGMNTGEIDNLPAKFIPYKNIYDFDLVYHGAAHPAKGMIYFLELARLLPEVVCVIPESKQKVEEIVGHNISLKNIQYIKCTWETGLKEIVSTSKIVINPSLWSAPIEGALLKSFAFNAHVATVKSDYGYEKEIADLMGQLRLDPIPINGALQIREFLKQDIYKSNKSVMENHKKLSNLQGSNSLSLFRE